MADHPTSDTMRSPKSSVTIVETCRSSFPEGSDLFSYQEKISALLKDGFAVDADGKVEWTESHPAHPRNWPVSRKVYDTGVMFTLEFFTTMISNTGSLTALAAHKELGISKELALFCFTSTYLLSQAVGSLIFSTYTESYGRRPTYAASALIFSIFTAVVGLKSNLISIIIGRCMSGLASAIPTAVLTGSVEDMWDIKARIWVIDVWVIAAICGLAVAPVYATAVEAALGWSWIYYLAALISFGLAIAIFFIRESRPSKALQRYLDKKFDQHDFQPNTPDTMPSFTMFLKHGLKKPFVLLCTEPLILVVTFMSASVYGFAYLLTEALPGIYAGFGLDTEGSARMYLFLAVGSFLALGVRVIDTRRAKQRTQQGQELTPEDKLLGFYIAAILQALAFWLLAWTIPPFASNLSPYISVLAIIPIGFAINEFDHVLLGYLVDCYTSVAGSACAPLGALRSVLSAVLPLLGSRLFDSLGNNCAVSVIAAVASLYIGVAVAFYFRGERFRAASPWARKQRESQQSATCSERFDV